MFLASKMAARAFSRYCKAQWISAVSTPVFYSALGVTQPFPRPCFTAPWYNLASVRNFAIAFFWNVFSQLCLMKFVLLDDTHTGSWGTRFVLVNLNKQSSYLNCYLKIITSNAYLISAIILYCSDMESGLYFIVGLHRLLNEVLHVYTRRL